MNRLSSRIALFGVVLFLLASVVRSCPYCVVESNTLTEEMDASDAVVLAKLIKPAAPAAEGPDDLGEFGVVDPETGKAKFLVEGVLLGDDLLEGVEEIEAIFFGEPVEGQMYFIRGVGVDKLDWNIPIPVSEAAVEYIHRLRSLPPTGPERMEYFLKFLQHSDPLLAQDSYDEFARAPYADVIALKDQIDRGQLWNWIEDREVSPSRRSLFFTMLGVCGQEEDIQRLRAMMLADVRVLRSAAEATAAAGLGLGGAITLPIVPEMVSMEQRRKQLGFNAMVGCFLKLTGANGLDVVDECFLKDPYADPTKVYGVLIALRFLGEETTDVPQQRLLESMRLVLDKPDFAEQAITDLARWEDWSVLERLVTMFKEAEPKTYVKEPIVAYLDQATRQEGEIGKRATEALAEVEQLDPDTVKRARSLMSFGFLARARTTSPNSAEPTANVEQEPVNDSPEAAASGDPAEASIPLANGDGDLSDGDLSDTPTDGQIAADSESGGEPLANNDNLGDNLGNAEPTTGAKSPAAAEIPAQPVAAQTPSEPNRLLLLGLPLVAAAGFVALVWAVLRGGA